MSTLLTKVKEIFSFHQGLSGEAVPLIADGCQHLKKLNLYGVEEISDEDIIHVIKKLGKQLTALTLHGKGLTDVAYSYLNNCKR